MTDLRAATVAAYDARAAAYARQSAVMTDSVGADVGIRSGIAGTRGETWLGARRVRAR